MKSYTLRPDIFHTELQFYSFRYTTYSAHPRVDAKAERMVNFGVDPAGRRAKLYVWEVDSRQRLLAKHTVPLLRRGTAAHDFLITVRLATRFHPCMYA